MDQLFQYFLLGISPFAAAKGTRHLFQSLRYSVPLKNAILDWITSADQHEYFIYQYMIVRSKLTGDGIINMRRIIFSISCIIFWIIVFIISYALSPDLYLTIVSTFYFKMSLDMPVTFIIITFSYVIFLILVTIVFDLLFSLFVRLRLSIYINIILLSMSYFICSIIVFFVISVYSHILVFAYDNDIVGIKHATEVILIAVNSSYQQTVKIILYPPSLFTVLYFCLTTLFTNGRDVFDYIMYNGILYGVNSAFVMAVRLALFPIALTCIVALTIVNISYMFSIIFMKFELFLRNKYGYDQNEIFLRPVEYIGRVSSIFVFVFFILINITAIIVSS